MSDLSHVDDTGRAKMVDVGHKPPQRRRAIASGEISLAPATVELVRDNQMKKGDVLTVAQIAGVQAAKRTAELIPLCHPLLLDDIDVQLSLTDAGVTARCGVACDLSACGRDPSIRCTFARIKQSCRRRLAVALAPPPRPKKRRKK